MIRPRQSYAAENRGFTLVEVIVSVALMGIVFSAAFGCYFLGMRLLEDARHSLRASQIIQSEVERVRTMNWSAIQALPATENFDPTGEYVAQFADLYSSTRNVSIVTAGDQVRIDFIVNWVNSRGRTYQETFSTIVTRSGLSDYLYSVPPAN